MKASIKSMTVIGRSEKAKDLDCTVMDRIYYSCDRFRCRYLDAPRKIYMSRDFYYKMMSELDTKYFKISQGNTNSFMNMKLVISKTPGIRVVGFDAVNY